MRKFKKVEPKHDITGIKFILDLLKKRIPLTNKNTK